MNLVLAYNDPTRTQLLVDGGPRYEISTSGDPPSTTIVRIDAIASTGKVGTRIGQIEGKPQGMTLQLCTTDHELVLHPSNSNATDLEAANSWAFTGPDDRPYKWQIFVQYPVLLLNDNSYVLLARYRRAKLGIVSRSRKAFLEILPAGLGIVDFIVVTFVSFMKHRLTHGNLDSEAE